MNYQLIDNEAAKQYELNVEGTIVKIEYIKVQDKIYLTHTEVPPVLEGKGLGSSIVKQALEDIKRQDLTLIPLCPFVALYIKRHPEWKELVLKGITIN
jgi:predicted GNAT family acetyltransferase